MKTLSYKKVIGGIALTLTVGSLHAQEPDLGEPYRQCMDKANTTLDMNGCIGDAMKEWDRHLNRLYRDKLSTLSASGQKSLRSAQRAWLKFRDHDCMAHSKMAEGGTLAGILYGECLLKKTVTRSEELESMHLD